MTETILKHRRLNLALVRIFTNDYGRRFVEGVDDHGPFTALLHQSSAGEEWFYGPGMEPVRMSEFHGVGEEAV